MNVDELLSLTEKALVYLKKKDLSRVYMISNKRKKLLNKLKFKSVPSDGLDSAIDVFKHIQELEASIRLIIEAELSELLGKVYTIRKELKFKDRFVGIQKNRRKIIDGKL